jgi:hypothetical protein
MIRAYCFASGHIEFGNIIPAGAIVIARGPAKTLREFIEVNARHGYRVRKVRGRPTKIPGSDTLLVPGVPEAPNQHVAGDALDRWSKGVRVLSIMNRFAGSSSSRAPTFPVGDAVSNPSPAPSTPAGDER